MTPFSSSITASTTPAEHVVHVTGRSGREIPSDVKAFGAGRTFCFLHGLVGLNDHWEDAAETVQDRLRCVLFQLPLLDLRGDDCSIDGVTELTARFLENHMDGPVTLVGNSFGGHVALRLALDYPELVGALVLAGSSGLIERTMVREVQIRPSREWLSEKIGELFHDRSKMREADLDRAHAELSERGGARAMVRLSRSARRDHLGDRVRDIACPVLLIWGREDIVTPPEAAEQFAQDLSDSRLVWLDDCGHAPMMEKPDEFAQALAAFADELDQRDAAGR